MGSGACTGAGLLQEMNHSVPYNKPYTHNCSLKDLLKMSLPHPTKVTVILLIRGCDFRPGLVHFRLVIMIDAKCFNQTLWKK